MKGDMLVSILETRLFESKTVFKRGKSGKFSNFLMSLFEKSMASY